MKNLLEETIKILESNHKNKNDVMWIGNGEYVISWTDFEKIANIEYNNGYGAQEIASDLLVVGKDWWLERHEYDGAEGWDFKSLPQKDVKTKPFHYVKVDEKRGTSCGWATIQNLEDVLQKSERVTE